MQCYECSQREIQRDAVAICHSCSAGLCGEHAVAVPQEVSARMPILRVVNLPLRSRRFLCPVCKEAWEQPGAVRAEVAR